MQCDELIQCLYITAARDALARNATCDGRTRSRREPDGDGQWSIRDGQGHIVDTVLILGTCKRQRRKRRGHPTETRGRAVRDTKELIEEG